MTVKVLRARHLKAELACHFKAQQAQLVVDRQAQEQTSCSLSVPFE